MGSQFSINGRIWLERNGEKILGRGRVELLERINASGSIRQAAMQMEMSYKQAWDMIKHMNNQFSSPLVISHRGGKGGGNAVVTPYGEDVIHKFRQLQEQFAMFIKLNENLQEFSQLGGLEPPS